MPNRTIIRIATINKTNKATPIFCSIRMNIYVATRALTAPSVAINAFIKISIFYHFRSILHGTSVNDNLDRFL